MAAAQFPLIFFKPLPGADPVTTARAIQNGSTSPGVVPLNPTEILQALQKTRGIARLKVTPPFFSFDNPRAEAAFEGTSADTHLHVRFFGVFEKVAEPLFDALTGLGLACYSEWDQAMVAQWPAQEEPTIDRGFAARMTRILERKTLELRETVSDSGRRTRILDAFMKSPEFRAEMATEARKEASGGQNKAYADVVNCYIRWKNGAASAAELAAVRKLDRNLSMTSVAELRTRIAGSPRLQVACAVTPPRAAELQRSAQKLGLTLDTEPA